MIAGVLTTFHSQYARQQYAVAPIDLEIPKVFSYDMRCAVVMRFSAWSSVYKDGGELQ